MNPRNAASRAAASARNHANTLLRSVLTARDHIKQHRKGALKGKPAGELACQNKVRCAVARPGWRWRRSRIPCQTQTAKWAWKQAKQSRKGLTQRRCMLSHQTLAQTCAGTAVSTVAALEAAVERGAEVACLQEPCVQGGRLTNKLKRRPRFEFV